MTHSNNIVVINQCTFILNPILTNWHHRKNIPQDSEAQYHASSHIKSTTIIWGKYQCCHCTPDCTKIPLLGVWHLAHIPLYNGKGFRTFLVFEDGLRCRFRYFNHLFKGWKLVLKTVYFEGWCTSKQVEKVLKVKLKFRGSKSGRPTDDLLWSSGRPTAILGIRTPGRPLNLHAVCMNYYLSYIRYRPRPTK